MSLILSPHEFSVLFPNVTESVKKRNRDAWIKQNAEQREEQSSKEPEASVCSTAGAVEAVREENSPKLEPDNRDELLRPVSGAGRDSEKHLVRYEIRRNRPIHDPENCCTKAFSDALRYAGIIPEDSFDALKIETTQVQVPKGQEGTVIEIFPPGTW